MEQYRREFFVSRICSGYLRFPYNGGVLKIYSPNLDIAYEGQEIYNEVYERAKAAGVATTDDIVEMLESNGMWSEYDNDQLENVLPKHIEYFKTEIYNHFDNEKQKDQTRKYLTKANEAINELFAKKHAYDYLTDHGIATFARWQFIVESSTYDGKNVYGWSDVGIMQVMEHINKNNISEEIIRDLARNDPWKNIWASGKKNGTGAFSLPAVSLSDEQKRLINWSSLYDNVAEHQDAPTEAVIMDDDAFDGWMIIKSRESKKDKEVNSVQKKLGKNSSMNAQEVFMVASDDDPNALFSKSEIGKIYSLNDPSSKNIINQRLALIQKHGEVNETEFPDAQREISIMRNKAINSAMRR